MRLVNTIYQGDTSVVGTLVFAPFLMYRDYNTSSHSCNISLCMCMCSLSPFSMSSDGILSFHETFILINLWIAPFTSSRVGFSVGRSAVDDFISVRWLSFMFSKFQKQCFQTSFISFGWVTSILLDDLRMLPVPGLY